MQFNISISISYYCRDSEPAHPFYENEQTRIESFKKWPFSFLLNPKDLARAGFFFNGPGDIVTCFQCNGTLANWDPKHDPINQHAKFFPNCIFISELVTDYFKPIHPFYDNEEKRLDSFYNWPSNSAQKPIELSKNGFFYSGQNDTVTCFHCNGSLANWSKNDNPLFDHAASFPNCPFVKNLTKQIEKPHHPFYKNQSTRLDSFKKWPFYYLQKPNDLSKAGFFYSGPKDAVTCFQCNGSLANWDPLDNPIKEHFQSFPKCLFIKKFLNKDNN